eukprot:jgi/Chlat1/4464/Chrsp29S00332
MDDFDTLSLRLDPPRIVIDNDSSTQYTIITIDSANRRGSLLEVVQTLSDLGLMIHKATVSSDGGWFVDVFHLTDTRGLKIQEDGLVNRIQERLFTVSCTFAGVVPSPSASSPQQANEKWCTIVELAGVDRPGLLSEVSGLLNRLQCSIHSAELWTHQQHVACVICVTDAAGKPIVDESALNRIRDMLLAVLRSDAAPGFASISSFGQTCHTERRLHQLMLMQTAEPDGSCSAPIAVPQRKRGPDRSTPVVTFKNMETMGTHGGYTLLSIRSPDRPKLFFDVLCTLTDMHYEIFHATIDSSDGLGLQEFYLRHKDGYLLRSAAEQQELTEAIHAAIMRRTPQGLRLEITSQDRCGLLSDVTRVFRESGVNIARAEVATSNGCAADLFYLTDVNGTPIDVSSFERLRREVLKMNITSCGACPDNTATSPSPPAPVVKGSPTMSMLRVKSGQLLWHLGLRSYA